MKRILIFSLIPAFLLGSALIPVETNIDPDRDKKTDTEWSMNATAIEACTCPMFCQCYFNTEPASHSMDHGDEEHFCRFNMAWKVNKGHYGDTNLEGAVFWLAGDLGSGWDDGNVDWATLHFDPSVTATQREGITSILGPLFPANWKSFTVKDDKPISWRADTKKAVALLDNGRGAEMRLVHPPTAMTDEPAVLTNVQYWGAPRHDGFIMMPNEVQAYRAGDKPFESRGTNGFMITIDINSADIQ